MPVKKKKKVVKGRLPKKKAKKAKKKAVKKTDLLTALKNSDISSWEAMDILSTLGCSNDLVNGRHKCHECGHIQDEMPVQDFLEDNDGCSAIDLWLTYYSKIEGKEVEGTVMDMVLDRLARP